MTIRIVFDRIISCGFSVSIYYISSKVGRKVKKGLAEIAVLSKADAKGSYCLRLKSESEKQKLFVFGKGGIWKFCMKAF